MREELARKLRRLRGERGLSLRKAAQVTGVTRETLSRLESGESSAFVATLEKIADGYNVPLDELIEPSAPAREWAAEMGARLHGMDGEEWDRLIAGIATLEEFTDLWHALVQERNMLHAGLAADKWQRPADIRRRRELSQGLRDIRAHRFADLAAEAALLRARDLVDEIFAALKEEATG